jgi:uncharacterized protein YndB with AHSA1/START domain
MSTNKDDRRGEFTVSRVVDAARDLVWQAFTECEHLAAFGAARTVARGKRPESSSGAPGRRRAHGGRYMDVVAFAGSNGRRYS